MKSKGPTLQPHRLVQRFIDAGLHPGPPALNRSTTSGLSRIEIGTFLAAF